MEKVWGKTVNGLRARLVCQRKLFLVGKPIRVRLDIECVRGHPKGRKGCQLFPHVSFHMGKEGKRVKLPITNRLFILQGKVYSRHFDVAKLLSIERPGRYVLTAGHDNHGVKDIGDWTGDVRSPSLVIEVLADTPTNRKLVERGIDEAGAMRSRAAAFDRRTVMTEAEARADIAGRDVDAGWSKDGPPERLWLEWFKKVGLKGKSPSVLITRHSDRTAPGEQSSAEVLRVYKIVGDRYLPVDELGSCYVSLTPEFFDYQGQQFVKVYLEYRGGGPTYTWWLDGSTAVRLRSEDPQNRVAGLLKGGERFSSTTSTPRLTAYHAADEEEKRRFRSWHSVYRTNGRGQVKILARIHATYRLEKDASGRPVRFVVKEARRLAQGP